MKCPPRVLRSLGCAFLIGAFASLATAQQTQKNPPRRLPPTGSQTSGIPAGVDSGTPATSDSMPLGTPVPPAAAADRNDQNKRSAAARAAARPAAASASAPASAAAINDSAAAADARRPAPATPPVRPVRSQKPSPPAR
jgi:hypothetical protein